MSIIMWQKYQKSDLITFSRNKELRDTRWKGWANVTKGSFFLLLFFLLPWHTVLIVISVFALAFEMLTNKIGLNANLFYNGLSSHTDKLKKWKWIILFAILVVTIFIKIKFKDNVSINHFIDAVINF